jgi:D-serine deaminase-like pyridoxal phosphate-dependent protein
MAKEKQPWNAWLYYQLAQRLLVPADFLLSSHLDKLRTEASGAAPPALSEGVTAEAPLVVKGANGSEYHFTLLSTEETVATQPGAPAALDIAVHYAAEPLPDPAAARQRNLAAATALLTAYPELRKPFHGVSVYADQKGQPTFPSEFSMADIR